MLALTTCAGIFSSASRFSSSATQPVPRRRPYSAERLSPTTSTVLSCWARAPRPEVASASTVQCLSQSRRASFFIPTTSDMSEPIIAVERVTKQVQDSTGTLTILHEIDFTLQPRQSAAIVGASGSGKSTLLSIVAGLDTPSRGTVRLGGDDIFAIDEDDRAALRAQKVGFVFQSFQLLANLT